VATLLSHARERGWDTCLALTPATERLLSYQLDELTAATGHPIRAECLPFGASDPFPPADAVLVAPLTFNTLNKWALGISDTAALGILNERLGQGVPIVCMPYVSTALARHPAYIEHVAMLRRMRVTVLNEGLPGPDAPERYNPGVYAAAALDALKRERGTS
jgi:phosphopantothenoylcysteine synthetase/decarboxylase